MILHLVSTHDTQPIKPTPVDAALERIAMAAKLADLKSLAARVIEADTRSKRGTKEEAEGAANERQFLISLLLLAATRDWREVLP